MTDETIDLKRERRIRRKIRGLAGAIEAAGERDAFDDNPTDYLENKAAMTDHKQAYTVADVAELLDVTTDSVRRWCRTGEIEAAKIGSAGYRISRPALEAFWRARGGGELFDRSPSVVSSGALAKMGSQFALDAIEAAGSNPTDVDGNSLLPNEPLPGDWEALVEAAGREPTDEERDLFAAAYKHTIEEHGDDDD